jgi:quercetin dioxygenase-like cupin family protein
MDDAVLGADAARPGEDAPRELAIARPEDPALVYLAVVGDTYTVLFSGEQTAGRFAMLDMLIPPGGGPPPHRHDFEECFRVLEGSVEVHVRDLPPVWLEVGESANIPANAPPYRPQRGAGSSATALYRRTFRPREVLRRVRRSRPDPDLPGPATQRHRAPGAAAASHREGAVVRHADPAFARERNWSLAPGAARRC